MLTYKLLRQTATKNGNVDVRREHNKWFVGHAAIMCGTSGMFIRAIVSLRRRVGWLYVVKSSIVGEHQRDLVPLWVGDHDLEALPLVTVVLLLLMNY